MKSWVVINAFLLAMNIAFAGAVWALYSLAKWAVPEFMESPFVVYPACLAALAAAILLGKWGIAFIGRRLGRGPGPSRV